MQQISKQNVFQKQMHPETNNTVYFSLHYIKIFETCHIFLILYPLVATEISTLIMPPMHMTVRVILKHCHSETNKQKKKPTMSNNKKKNRLIGLISFPVHLYSSVQLHIHMYILWRFSLLNLILLQAH